MSKEAFLKDRMRAGVKDSSEDNEMSQYNHLNPRILESWNPFAIAQSKNQILPICISNNHNVQGEMKFL
jgi:hypothetical protein